MCNLNVTLLGNYNLYSVNIVLIDEHCLREFVFLHSLGCMSNVVSKTTLFFCVELGNE